MDNPGAPPAPTPAVASTSTAVPVLELATDADLGCGYKGEFREPGRGYIGTLEVYTKEKPLGFIRDTLPKKTQGGSGRRLQSVTF